MKHEILILLAALSPMALGNTTQKVEAMIEEINTLRETLVNGVTERPSPETFQAVCKPVGVNLKKRAGELGVKVRQASDKYRNPEHKATALEMTALQTFRSDKDKVGYWQEKDGQRHYFRRIDVLNQCLACHGPKDQRPQFVTSKFPDDRAFGFKQGDLRGVYHVILDSR